MHVYVMHDRHWDDKTIYYQTWILLNVCRCLVTHRNPSLVCLKWFLYPNQKPVTKKENNGSVQRNAGYRHIQKLKWWLSGQMTYLMINIEKVIYDLVMRIALQIDSYLETKWNLRYLCESNFAGNKIFFEWCSFLSHRSPSVYWYQK